MANIIQFSQRDPDPSDVRIIAEITLVGAMLPKSYLVAQVPGGIVLMCSVRPKDPAETFFIPTEVRDWLASSVALTRVQELPGLRGGLMTIAEANETLGAAQ